VSPSPRRPLVGTPTSPLREPARAASLPEGRPRPPEIALERVVRALVRPGGRAASPAAAPALAPAPLVDARVAL
jgi:hypothetical protein